MGTNRKGVVSQGAKHRANEEYGASPVRLYEFASTDMMSIG